MTDCPEPDWYPDPPLALIDDWTSWRELALAWITHRKGEWTADDLRADMPEGRSNWPGAAIHTAASRGLITDAGRMVHSVSKTRKRSRLPVWQTTHTPKETP